MHVPRGTGVIVVLYKGNVTSYGTTWLVMKGMRLDLKTTWKYSVLGVGYDY